MNQTINKRIFLMGLIGVLILSITAIGSTQETIRLASGEWSPYQSKKLKYYGVASRIVTEAFAMGDIRVEYGYFPWKRSYKNAEKGKWDGTFLWFDTVERRKKFYVSDPIINIQYVFFYLKTYPFDWTTIDDLKEIKIGGTLEYNYGDMFQNAEKTKKINVHRIATDEQNFKKLLKGRIQIFPNDLDAGYEILHKHFTPEQVKLFTYHPIPLKVAPHHLLLPIKIKKNRQMLEIFNQGLSILKKTGKINQYLSESRRGSYNKN